MTSVRRSPELEARLEHLATLTGRTKTFHVRQLLEEQIDELEDRYIAEHRLENPDERLPSQQVRRELGLED